MNAKTVIHWTILRLRNLDSKLRSLVKSVSWLLLGILVLGLIAWIYTGNVEQTSFITITFNEIQILFYYFHERLWENVGWGRGKN
jgi:uncharacterized membrane protein